MINLIICGIAGRMGTAVWNTISSFPNLKVIAGIDRYAKKENYPFAVFTSFAECSLHADAIIDFSRPEALSDILTYATREHSAVVIATTGYTTDQQSEIRNISKTIPVFQSFNMSLGLNLLSTFVKKAAEFLGDSFDIEIVEKHHNLKVDAPSGTALMLAGSANSAFDGQKEYQYGRHGASCKRTQNEIGIHSIRGGTIVGEHEVMFIGSNEMITLSHSATSREIFAHGALRAAEFLVEKTDGYYDMQDVISAQYAVNTVKSLPNQTLLYFENVTDSAAIFEIMANSAVNIDLINQSGFCEEKQTLSITIPDHDFIKASKALDQQLLTYQAMPSLTKLVAEGIGMQLEHGIASTLISLLKSHQIPIYLISSGETEISICTAENKSSEAVKLIKAHFKTN